MTALRGYAEPEAVRRARDRLRFDGTLTLAACRTVLLGMDRDASRLRCIWLFWDACADMDDDEVEGMIAADRSIEGPDHGR